MYNQSDPGSLILIRMFTKECSIRCVSFMRTHEVTHARGGRYSTNQKKPKRERLTERVLLPFHTHSRSRSVSVLYPFHTRSISVLFCSHSASVPSVSVLGTHSEERGFRELVYKNASMELATLKLSPYVRVQEFKQ